ncbi:hypothetical protein BGZ94_007431 [Podila epigama]|nr:hypothetical protein BGZ94_007431 [Podila epigama]
MFSKLITIAILATVLFSASVSALPANSASNKCYYLCTMEYDPICATSKTGVSRSFPNACGFASHNCNNPTNMFLFLSRGECRVECPTACSDDISPVCAFSKIGSKTFSNICEYKIYNCKNPNNWFTSVSEGKCES